MYTIIIYCQSHFDLLFTLITPSDLVTCQMHWQD